MHGRPGAAQSDGAPGDEARTVRVAGHYDNAVGTSDAASQGVITTDLIVNRPALRTGEMLEFVPGMIVTQHSGDGKANQYFLRGFNLDHGTDFATFVDGMPVNMPTHAHGQGYTDLNFLIPELVQRIDYRKGPYFADEGDFASAGAARIRLTDRLPQGMASLSLGSMATRAACWPIRSTAAQRHLAVRPGTEPQRRPVGHARARPQGTAACCATAQGTPDDGYSVTGMAYTSSWNSTDQIPLRAVESGLIGRFGAIDPTDGGDTARYSLSYAMRKRTRQSACSNSTPMLMRSQLDLFSNFTYFLADPVQGDQFQQSERRTVAGVNTGASWHTKLAGLAMRNKIGLQTRYDRLSPVGLYGTVARQRTDTVREDRVRESSVGLYAENSTQWLPWLRSGGRPALRRLSFQCRQQHRWRQRQGRRPCISPKLSLIFGPWSKTEYFVNYGKGFHSNDARGTTQTRLPDGSASSPGDAAGADKRRELGAAHGDGAGPAKFAGAVAPRYRLRTAVRRRRRRDRAEPRQPPPRHRVEQPLHRRALAAVRPGPGRLALALHAGRSGRQLHSRLDRQGGVVRRDR